MGILEILSRWACSVILDLGVRQIWLPSLLPSSVLHANCIHEGWNSQADDWQWHTIDCYFTKAMGSLYLPYIPGTTGCCKMMFSTCDLVYSVNYLSSNNNKDQSGWRI